MAGTFIFRFKDMKPVIKEAQKNKCKLILVKDQGLYFMPEVGERDANGRYINIAYAEGFNPDKVEFDDWYDALVDGAGGDDFGEYMDSSAEVFTYALKQKLDIKVIFTETHYVVDVIEK